MDSINLALLKKKKNEILVNHSDDDSIVNAFKRINSYKEGGSMSDKISNAILFMICKDLCLISTVENEGFLNLLKIFAPLYKLILRKTMMRNLESRYEIIYSTLLRKKD